MSFLKQTAIEIKNVLRSKFVFIIGIIVLAASIAFPILSYITQKAVENINPGGPIIYETMAVASSKYYEGDYQESITVDGVTITNENPFFWNIKSLVDQKGYMSTDTAAFSSPEALDLALELIDYQIQHYLRLAVVITSYDDYRADLGWQTETYLFDKFIYDHYDVDEDTLFEVMQYMRGFDEATFKEKYIDITAEERLAALNEVEDMLDKLYETIENNDFDMYVQLRIQQENDQIAQLEEQIALHEQTIIDNPSQEEYLNQMIEDLRRQINMIETNSLPIWEYRLEKHIVPNDGSWQNSAISEIENYRNQVMYITIVPEEEFVKDRYLTQQYGTYEKYKQAMQAQIDDANEHILIAQHSLDADKPDMKFVPDGARNKTVGFLGYSVFIALFSVLVGGWLIAREFSGGTIRLLMIRPKTRTKILMSKFLAALIISIAVYAAGCIIDLMLNGILYGFADFGFPNFTASGEVGFFAYYVPKFIACIVTILLGYTCAFMLSTVTKNVAVSIIVPVVCFIGSFLGMTFLQYSRAMNWLAYTPIPYVQMSSFFTQWSPVNTLISRGVPISLTYGIILLLAMSAVFTLIAVWVFKKKDITK